MVEISRVVFKERVGRKSVNKNRVSGQRLFSFEFPLPFWSCFSLTENHGDRREESRGPPEKTLSQALKKSSGKRKEAGQQEA